MKNSPINAQMMQSPNPEIRPILRQNFPGIPETYWRDVIALFLTEWIDEACQLRTPCSDLGVKILEALKRLPDDRVTMEKPLGLLPEDIFDKPPTFNDVERDLDNTTKKEVQMIDTETGAAVEAEHHKIKTILNTVIHSIENRTFDANKDRHFSVFNIPISRSGVGKCHPKVPPKLHLTSLEPKPKG